MAQLCDNRLIIAKAPGAPFNARVALRELHPDPGPLLGTSSRQVVDALAPKPANQEVLSFERLLPTPHEKVGEKWADWRVSYWGTKVDAHNSKILDQYDHMVKLSFLTKWSAPIEWFETLAREHPEWKMELAYIEEEGRYAGHLKAQNGKVTSYAADPKALQENMF